MKTLDLRNDITVENAMESRSIGLDDTPEARSQLSKVLRDSTYNDKPLAAVRETITNAVDETLRHDVSQRPTVTLPSEDNDYTFSVRDYAKGLSRDDAFDVFFRYFKSTKRNCMITTGCKGLGSKAISAFCPVYQVMSFFEGKRYTFAGTVRGDEFDSHLVSVEDSDEPSGILVTAQVTERQSAEILRAFKDFYCYFKSFYKLEIRGYDMPEDFKYFDPTEPVSQDFDGKFIYQRGIRYNYPLLPCDMSLVINDDAILDIHPSRESLEQTDRNKVIVDGAVKLYTEEKTQELQELVDEQESMMDCFKLYNERKNEIKFYKNFGLTMPTIPSNLSIRPDELITDGGDSRYRPVYQVGKKAIIRGGRYCLQKLAWYSTISLSLKTTKFLWLNLKTLKHDRHDAIEEWIEENGYSKEDCYIVCTKDPDSTKEALDRVLDGLADSVFIDVNHVKPPAGEKKAITSFQAFTGQINWNNKVKKNRCVDASTLDPEKIYYYFLLERGSYKGKYRNDINNLDQDLFPTLGINKSKEKSIPKHWRKVEVALSKMANKQSRDPRNIFGFLSSMGEASCSAKVALELVGAKSGGESFIKRDLLNARNKRFLKRCKKKLDSLEERCSNDPELANAFMVYSTSRHDFSLAVHKNLRKQAKQKIIDEITI